MLVNVTMRELTPYLRAQKSLAILIILINHFASVTSGGDVVQDTGKLYAKGSGHDQSLADAGQCYNARTDPIFDDWHGA